MKQKISLKDLQSQVDKWIRNHGGYWSPLAMLGAIMEEIGELSKEINYQEGFKPKKRDKENQSSLGEELADTLFALICVANHYQIDLEDEFKNIIKKYSMRDRNRFI